MINLRLSDFGSWLQGFAPTLHSDSSQICWMGLRSGLCMPVKVFHTMLGKPFLYGLIELKLERASSRLLQQIFEARYQEF